MSIETKGYAAYCDAQSPGCEGFEDVFQDDTIEIKTKREARKALKLLGWKCGKRDICPACQNNSNSEGE